MGTNLILPGRGAPSGSATRFSRMVPSHDEYSYSVARSHASYSRERPACGRCTGFISPSLTQRKWYMPPVVPGWQRISCYENRTDAYQDRPAGCDRWCPSRSMGREPHCNHAHFPVPKSENPVGSSSSCTIETDVRISPEGVGSCATKWWSEASGAARNPWISYAGRGAGQ